jgi:hypothetical protein
MFDTINKWIWILHSCCSELLCLGSDVLFFKNIRVYFRALQKEEQSLELLSKAEDVKIMVIAGSGPLPYTALFYRKNFDKIVCIEKNRLFAFLAAEFFKKNKINNVQVVNKNAYTFDYPNKILIYISLLTQSKQEVLQSAMKSQNSLICLRVPLDRAKKRYESVNINTPTIARATVNKLAMQSILLESGHHLI